MFERAHHVRISAVLEALDSELLAQHRCYFGGGTAITLLREEFRESVDIDFIVSERTGFAALREALLSKGIAAIARSGTKLEATRALRADQYGIRTLLLVGGAEIKFEVVLERRVSLEVPKDEDRVCGVVHLTLLDLATTKLLANSDWWADDGVFSRDLIDLAMLAPERPLLKRALEKAEAAYGQTVVRDLEKAVARLRERKGRLDECMTALQIDDVPKALLWRKIRRLVPKSR